MRLLHWYFIHLFSLVLSFILFGASTGGWFGFMIFMPIVLLVSVLIIAVISAHFLKNKSKNSKARFNRLKTSIVLASLTAAVLVNGGDNGDNIGSFNFYQKVFNLDAQNATISPFFIILAICLFFSMFLYHYFSSIYISTPKVVRK